MLLQANANLDIGALLSQYSWVLMALLVLFGILAVGIIVVLRRYEIGPFKKYPYACTIVIGLPPGSSKIETPGRINSSDKTHPFMEFKFPKGAVAPLPSYEEYVNMKTMFFFGINRNDIHPMKIEADENTKQAVMRASIDDRARGIYKQNTKAAVERTTEFDKLMQYMPIIGGIMIIIIVILGGYWISSMTTTAAGIFAAAANAMTAATQACGCAANAGPLPP